MTQPAEKGSEFGTKDNELILKLAKDLVRLGVAVLVAGILLMAYSVFSYLGAPILLSTEEILRGLTALFIIFISMIVFRLAVPMKMIATTSTLHTEYFMSFVKNLRILSGVSIAGLIFFCCLIIINILLLKMRLMF